LFVTYCLCDMYNSVEFILFFPCTLTFLNTSLLQILVFFLLQQQKYLDDRAKAEQEQEAKEKAADEVEDEEEEEEEEDEDEEEEEEDLSGEYEELLETIRETKEQNNGRLDDELVIKFFREKLLSKPCQNQGFIIDGFPKTLEQAKDLFASKLHELLQIFSSLPVV